MEKIKNALGMASVLLLGLIVVFSVLMLFIFVLASIPTSFARILVGLFVIIFTFVYLRYDKVKEWMNW